MFLNFFLAFLQCFLIFWFPLKNTKPKQTTWLPSFFNLCHPVCRHSHSNVLALQDQSVQKLHTTGTTRGLSVHKRWPSADSYSNIPFLLSVHIFEIKEPATRTETRPLNKSTKKASKKVKYKSNAKTIIVICNTLINFMDMITKFQWMWLWPALIRVRGVLIWYDVVWKYLGHVSSQHWGGW